MRADIPCNVVATVLHAHHGHGMLVRLLETAGEPAGVRLVHPFGAAGGIRSSAVERPFSSVAVEANESVPVHLRPFEVVSVLLDPQV